MNKGCAIAKAGRYKRLCASKSSSHINQLEDQGGLGELSGARQRGAHENMGLHAKPHGCAITYLAAQNIISLFSCPMATHASICHANDTYSN